MRNRELKACGKRGHVTYAPTEADLAARLRAQTALGEAWRCLRCGTWVLGKPKASGPADQAPVPPRGKALRQLTILRVLAVERVIRGIVLIAAGYGVYRFESAQRALQGSFGRLVPALRPLADQFGVDLDHSAILSGATKALHARAGTLNLVAIGLVVYGLLELVEGVGLWLAKRWGEYLTVIATAAFLPYEVSELIKSVTVTKAGAFLINVLAVVYLLLAKRLFGLRGGRKAYEAELRGESLLEVEAAGQDRTLGDGDPGRSEGMSEASAGKAETPVR
ncbi:MAG: hypothetical protein QOJ68_1872 [Blastococcus sp.]|nr:hypothetical protein [Blastococcus sp.]